MSQVLVPPLAPPLVTDCCLQLPVALVLVVLLLLLRLALWRLSHCSRVRATMAIHGACAERSAQCGEARLLGHLLFGATRNREPKWARSVPCPLWS